MRLITLLDGNDVVQPRRKTHSEIRFHLELAIPFFMEQLSKDRIVKLGIDKRIIKVSLNFQDIERFRARRSSPFPCRRARI